MELDIKTTFKASVEFEAYKNKTEYSEGLKSHNCNIGEWYSDETCDELDLSKEISKHLQENKEYKISVQIVEV